MKITPKTDNPLLLRANFLDDHLWNKVCQIALSPKEFIPGMTTQADIEPYNDIMLDGASAEQIIAALPTDKSYWFIFIIDNFALTQPDFPILCVDLIEDFGNSFRVIASELYQIENNLSTSNVSFSEFANQVDTDGVFCQKLF